MVRVLMMVLPWMMMYMDEMVAYVKRKNSVRIGDEDV